MADRSDVDWETCDEDECVGAQLPSGGRCWAHADAQDLGAALETLGDRDRLDACGVSFTAELLQRVLAAARDDQGRANLRTALFYKATFTDNADFGEVNFLDDASFDGATFTGDAMFEGAYFSGIAMFDGATFKANADFIRARFAGNTHFGSATFAGDAGFRAMFYASAQFEGAIFKGNADFRGRFNGDTHFEGATFGGDAEFGTVRFDADAMFDGASFWRVARFVATEFRGSASFSGAHFPEGCNFSGAQFDGDALVFDAVTFPNRIAIAPSVHLLSGRYTVFLAGADLRLPGVRAEFERAEFAGPSVVSGARILSLNEARVGDLTLTGVDLSECRFAGARGLDSMRLEGDSCFPWSPGKWRWTARRVILEECAWRAQGQNAWSDLCPATASHRAAEADPRRIADTYRGLRKAKEDSKDEPGAADFYYGEMEMRRHALRQGGHGVGGLLSFWGERIVVTAYWLVSGYGLRAVRALLALAATIALGAALLHWFGFVPNERPEDGTLLFALDSSISLLRVPEGDLTAGGHVVQIVLRLLGPLFFGLALLALRGRVRR